MSGDSKKKTGRPPEYKREFCDTVRELLSQGYSLTACAGQIGFSRETVYNWMEAHPEFLDAVKAGRAAGQHIWEERLTKLALTGEGNATATIFAMKNLYRQDWNDRTEISGPDGGPIKTEETGQGAAKLAAFLDTIAERSGTAGEPDA